MNAASTPQNVGLRHNFNAGNLSSVKRGNRSFPDRLDRSGSRSFKERAYKSATEESLIQWFDRSLEKEINKLKESPTMAALINPTVAMSSTQRSVLSGPIPSQVVRSSTSGLGISASLRGDPDSDLKEAALRLVKAEELCRFEGAVKAAEEAAASASPDMAEEAAAATARDFKTEVTGFVQETISDSFRPVEVIGYVGITRPKNKKV